MIAVEAMKNALSPLRNCALLALPLFALASSAAPAPAAQPAAPSATQDDQVVWRAAFKKAMDVGAQSEMERLIKKNTHAAVEWIIDTAQAISTKTNDDLETRMAALRKAWKGAIGSQFATNMYEYFSLIDPVYKEERRKLKLRYDKAYDRYNGNFEKRDQPTYGVLYNEFETLSKAFSDLGDYYFSGQCWLMAYTCTSEGTRGDNADLYKACHALKMMIADRKKVDLQDNKYLEASTAYSYLKANGYDEAPGDEGGGEAGPAGGPPKAGPRKEAAAVAIQLGFEMIDDFLAYERPSYYADEIHNLWTRIALQKKGSKTSFSSLGKLSPKLERTGSAEVLIDADGDGEGEVSVPLRGNVDPIQFEVGEGGEKRPWGCLTKIGTQSDMYQSIQISMQPTDDQMQIYLAPGASMVGDVEGTSVRIIDENMDGIYGGEPTFWGHDGLTKDMLHPEVDSMLIGGSKRALPYSEYQKIGDKWYRLEVENFGTAIRAYATELVTGKVKVSFKGGKPTWIIVQGKGKYEKCYFDLMQKDLELPVGGYTLLCGELRKGKKLQTMKALMLPGKGMPTWTVSAGETTKVQLGAPFGFDFTFENSADSVTVHGDSIAVTGVGGERYERLWNCVARPEIAYRPKGRGKGAKGGDMKLALSQEEINEGGWKVAWFPYDLTVKKKSKSDETEVMLTQKKNKLFGKIESDWKE